MVGGTVPGLAVFDCDGTLVDSQHSIIHSMFQAFDTHGHARPEAEAVRRVVGLSLREAMRRLLPDGEDDDHERLEAGYVETFRSLRENGAVEDTLFPGTLDALSTLREEGWVLGVATGKSSRGLRATLDSHGIRDWFKTLQTADRGPGKPDPQMLYNAISETGMVAASTVMIGDTTYDIEMARRAGTVAIGVSWGYHPPSELHSAGADSVIEDFSELPGRLRDLGASSSC